MKFEHQKQIHRKFVFFDIFKKVKYGLSEFGKVLNEVI